MRPVSAIYDPNPPAPNLECDIFSRVQILTQPLGGHSIAWELSRNFSAPGPMRFYVDFGRSGTNEWEPISNVPIVDGCIALDPKQRHYDHLADFYYRVRLVLPNVIDPLTGSCKVYISQPQQANGIWSKRDWLLAREIARKEYLLQRKRTNLTATGNLLKLRRWGTVCIKCVEFETDEPQSVMCELCYGTRYLGGYFPAVDYVFTLDAPWGRSFKYNPQVSLQNNVFRVGRGVAYPYMDTGDVFVRNDTGERFQVSEIAQVAEVGNIPVIVSVKLALVPVTNIIYRIPLTGGIASSSSPLPPTCRSSSDSSSGQPQPQPAPCNHRIGLNDQEDW